MTEPGMPAIGRIRFGSFHGPKSSSGPEINGPIDKILQPIIVSIVGRALIVIDVRSDQCIDWNFSCVYSYDWVEFGRVISNPLIT